MKKFNLVTSILVSILASSAYAGGASPFYLGATIGQSDVDNNASQMDNHGFCENASSYGEDCRIGDSDDTYHIYGGVRISESIAIEAGYANLGDTASYYYTDPINVSQETDGITAAGVYRQRIGKTSPIQVYGKAGAFAWRTEAESIEDSPGQKKDTGIDPMIGAGVEYDLSHNVSLRAGWDRYYNVGKGETLVEFNDSGDASINTLETDVDVYSAGIQFSTF